MRKFNFEKYYEQFENMPEPIMTSDLPKVKINLTGVREYARKQGVTVAICLMKKNIFLWKYNYLYYFSEGFIQR